jgi:hypothetical protein
VHYLLVFIAFEACRGICIRSPFSISPSSSIFRFVPLLMVPVMATAISYSPQHFSTTAFFFVWFDLFYFFSVVRGDSSARGSCTANRWYPCIAPQYNRVGLIGTLCLYCSWPIRPMESNSSNQPTNMALAALYKYDCQGPTIRLSDASTEHTN